MINVEGSQGRKAYSIISNRIDCVCQSYTIVDIHDIPADDTSSDVLSPVIYDTHFFLYDFWGYCPIPSGRKYNIKCL